MRRRLRQFREATRTPSESDFALARSRLTGPLFQMFAAQHPRDIVHSAGTARWLLEREHLDGDLLTAALLHDVGKGQQRRTDRAAYVLAALVRLQGVLGSPASRFEVRRAIARTRMHSESGAAALAAAGANDRVVYLTRFHHTSPAPDPVLALLQQADDAN